jgi:hypothetical protein
MPGLGRQLARNLDEMRKKAVSHVAQMWTDDDAEVIAFPEPEHENDDLPADSEGGQYWDRTSDPCVVSGFQGVFVLMVLSFLLSDHLRCFRW